jgi:hypothetical protein
MTSKNSSKISDTACRATNSAAHEPGSEQAMFIEKLRSAAKSSTDVFSRAGSGSKRLEHSKPAKNSAVQDILHGFILDGIDTT